jgi:hypothetical protein
MATVQFRGKVSYPEAKKAGNGRAFSKFAVGSMQKEKAYQDRPEKVTWANFQVTDWNKSSPPPNGAIVDVEGYLKVNEVTRDGKTRTYLEVNATKVSIYRESQSDAAEPPPPAAGSGQEAEEDDPFDVRR